MSPAGRGLDILQGKKRLLQVLLTLKGLHDKNIFHGDARIQNIIFTSPLQTELFWIDFRRGALCNTRGPEQRITDDIWELAKSLGA